MESGPSTISGVPPGSESLVISEILKSYPGRDLLFVARDEMRMEVMADALSFICPEEQLLLFPAWDCLPYDRLSPKQQVGARRINALSNLTESGARARLTLLTTCNATLQRIPTGLNKKDSHWLLTKGDLVNVADLTGYLVSNGYTRLGQAMEPGDFAVRGSIIDVYPADAKYPVRVDLFGDEVDEIKIFDPVSQRSEGSVQSVSFLAASELLLDADKIARFRENYRTHFGAITDDNPLYESVSAGRKFEGMEHWLPFFYENLCTLFDYLPDAAIVLDSFLEVAIDSRVADVKDFYDARLQPQLPIELGKAPKYNPVPVGSMFLSKEEWHRRIQKQSITYLNGFTVADGSMVSLDVRGRKGKNFSNERRSNEIGLFDSVTTYLEEQISLKQRVVLACQSHGSRDRLAKLLSGYGITNMVNCEEWKKIFTDSSDAICLIVFPLETGFAIDNLTLISEGDVLGDRLSRGRNLNKKARDFISDATKLIVGDLVVHTEHGVGRFQGLTTIETSSAPHDCVQILYSGGDYLYLPVENLDVLGRYGSGSDEARLDTLGSHVWRNRKSRVKSQIRDMAAELIHTAAERVLKKADAMVPESVAFEEFCGRFPYVETEDQLSGIEECLAGISRSVPMDRLICGDVGFGKTEVALRTAFVAAQSGKQVAIVAPTTLLARQHYETFSERFKGFGFSIAQLSRLVPVKKGEKVREGLRDGEIDIVIGTHALLSKSIRFKRLGLFIIDEEQHFGVGQKEQLKSLKSGVHVLTLTATPIPRTLQLALSGVRSMSIIATPPIDRLSVRTFILPYDGVVVKEAILREQSRGGQIFYICPQIKDLDTVSRALKVLAPETRIVIAHGQMSPSELDRAMTSFYERKFDLLLATSIIESGLDIPTVNTLIVHRSDRFGLAQLYQLRGRVGRSKVRAYAYFTVNSPNSLQGDALKRLEALNQLDSVGSGFSLASHDLDIRGAGNLLGEEQSGKVREVGVELYQKLLEEAVDEANGRSSNSADQNFWSPQIELGAAVLIPEAYVPDLSVRLGLYRRLGAMRSRQELDNFGAELVDRFGNIPEETEHLLRVVAIKQLCWAAHVMQIDAGPRGLVVSFFNDFFPAGEKLIAWITRGQGQWRLRPDHKLVVSQIWGNLESRFKGVEDILLKLASLVKA